MKTRLRTALLAASAALSSIGVAGCAAPSPAVPASAYTGWFKGYAGCRDEYTKMDARVEAAGVGSAMYYRVPGYPYLRTDRTMASYKDSLDTPDLAGAWLRRMREFDQEAREFEYMDLGMSMQEIAIQRFRFLECGRIVAGLELDDPAALARMKAVVTPPDDYSSTARLFGFYSFAAAGMKARVEQRHADALREQEAGVPADPAAPLHLWTAKQVEDHKLIAKAFARALPDEFGFPGFVDSEWRALAEVNAPHLWVETAGDGDRPAAPILTEHGPGADVAKPSVYWWATFARFGDVPLPQITYFVWFPAAGGTGRTSIDGMIWRVTLDVHGAPLVYESVHGSGRDHRFYPVQALARRDAPEGWEEPPFIAPALAPAHDVTLRLRSGSHDVRRVVAAEAASTGDHDEYELQRYEDLFALPSPGGGAPRSLFNPEGLIEHAQTPDPVGGIASGIPAPGTLRQYGHHPIVHVGRKQFDDPFLLSTVFVPPPAEPQKTTSIP